LLIIEIIFILGLLEIAWFIMLIW